MKHLSCSFVCRTALRRRCPTPPLSPSRRRRRSKTSIILWFPAPMGSRARRASPPILSRMPTSWLHVVECFFGKEERGQGGLELLVISPTASNIARQPIRKHTSRHLRELFALVRSFFVFAGQIGFDFIRRLIAFHSSPERGRENPIRRSTTIMTSSPTVPLFPKRCVATHHTKPKGNGW